MTRTFPGKCLSIILPLLIWLALFPSGATAQSYNIKTYRYQDGLTSNIVFNGAQDHRGNLWFATRNGLTVFDGVDWRDPLDGEPGIPLDEGMVSIGNCGTIWWASLRSPMRVTRRIDGKWQDVPAPNIDGPGWVLTGFRTFTDSSGRTSAVLASRNGGLHLWDGQEWTTLAAEKPELLIFSLELDRSTLLASTSLGLLKVDLDSPATWSFKTFDIPEGPVFATASDPACGSLWIIGENWLAQVENQKVQRIFNHPQLIMNRPFPVASACQSPDGGLYYVDSSLAFYFHPKTGVKNLGLTSGIATDDGTWAMTDREGNIWITSIRGISKIVSRSLECYTTEHGLLENEVSAIIQRKSGTVVLGHRGGLTFFDSPKRTLAFDVEPRTLSRVMALAEDENEQLWIAAHNQGLGLLKPNNEIQWFGPDSGLQVPVYSLLPHPEHGLFVGTRQGLFHKVGPRFVKIPLPGVDPGQLLYVRNLTPLRSGGFALATQTQGVFQWLNGTITRFPGNNLPGLPEVFTVFEHPDGRLWAGTHYGLCVVKDGKLEMAVAPDPEIRRPIYGILQKEPKEFWFGTDEGIVIWDGLEHRAITARDGLLGSETNRGAFKLSHDGNVWIGTEGGLSVYQSDFDIANQTAPILSLTEIIINGESVPMDEPLQVTGPIGSLVFNFRAPFFKNDSRVKFRVRATKPYSINFPLNTQWPGVLSLTNVPPGKFVMEIQAITSDGLLSNTIISPMISIAPPLVDRWYSRLLMGLAGTLLLWFAFAYFSGRRYAQRLEEEVGQQTRELRKSEEAARLESEHLSGTLESISDGVVVIDGKGRVILLNRAAKAMFSKGTMPTLGCTLEDIVPVESVVDAEQANRYRELLNNPTGVRIVSEQVPIQISSKSVQWFEISIVPINVISGGLVFAFRNISDRRRLEQKEQRNQKLESLGLLAGGIAHDFNNLLTIMLGNLSLVTRTLKSTPEEDSQLDSIRLASERARGLTQQLLTFAKGGEPVKKPSDIGEIIREATSFSLSGSNTTCHLDLADDLLWAEVDTDQISQVIGNLVINAFQAMPDGGNLNVSARNAVNWAGFMDNQRVVVIEVQDHGTGISEKDQLRIFDPYFTTKEDGSGLGLAIVLSIAQKHGGQLSLDSTLGKGSTFRFVLPACNPGVDSVALESISSSPTENRKLRVLFMDDERAICNVMDGMLAHLGHESESVEDGKGALNAFITARTRNCPFDLVILDLTIPGRMGGREAAAELRKLDARVPIIVASGYNDDPVMAHPRQYGFSGILMKPFTMDALKLVLAKTIPFPFN